MSSRATGTSAAEWSVMVLYIVLLAAILYVEWEQTRDY